MERMANLCHVDPGKGREKKGSVYFQHREKNGNKNEWSIFSRGSVPGWSPVQIDITLFTCYTIFY